MKSLLCLSMILFLSACRAGNVAPAGDDVNPIPDVDTWAVELHVTGGFAGMQRSIYIGNNAKVIVKDARRKLYIERLLTRQQLAEVEALLPEEQSVSPDTPGKCRDCFNYNLAYRYKDKTGRIRANDMNLAKTKDKELIHKLMAIQNRIIQSYKK